MCIIIKYCSACGYHRRALNLAAHIKAALGIQPELVAEHDAHFEVSKDDTVVFSMKAEGRFPENAEVLDKLE